MRRQLTTIALAGAALLGACARVGVQSAPTPPSVPGDPDPPSATELVFGGTVTLGGQRLPVYLELTGRETAGPHATLRIPDVPVEASGKGSWSGDRLRLVLRYGDGCPGTVSVDARLTERGAEGTLEAHDCTGSDAGPLVLVRRSTAAPER